MAVVTPGAAVWAVATRISLLDANGFPAAGSSTFTTNTLVKATVTPVYESGDAIAVKTAGGELGVYALHGDMEKWRTISMELVVPDPQLEALICGGTVLSSNTATLGLTTGLTVTPQTTLGTLLAGTYGYRTTQYSMFGETLAEAEVTGTTTGSTGANVLTGAVMAAGALGVRVYGRQLGGEQYMGSYINIGTQATSAASGTGTVASLATATGLTSPIPAGYTFQIAGDTNTPKIVFTTTQEVGVGAVAIPVSTSQTVTTTIAAGNIVPCFVDSGSIVPSGALPLTDLSAGPGTGAGYQDSAPGTTAQPNGVSVEFWSKRIINGFQATDYPYIRTVLPRVANMHIMPRDYTNANLATVMDGDAFRNPNWGSGPFNDWPFDSSQVSQRSVCGRQAVPVAGFAAVPALG